MFSCGIEKWLAFTVGYHTYGEFDHFLITGPNHLCRFSGVQQQENYYSILKQNLHVKISAFSPPDYQFYCKADMTSNKSLLHT